MRENDDEQNEDLSNDDGRVLSHESNSVINSENQTISSMSSSFTYQNPFSYAIMNARSVSAKIGSLIDSFRNLELSFACISETWLKSDGSLSINMTDLEESQQIGLIIKNRKSRGGGVAIAFDKNKMSLKNFPNKSKYEFVCASGKSVCNRRPVLIISYYVCPSLKAENYREMASDIEDCISRAKTSLQDPMVFIAGDANRRDVSIMHEDFVDVENTNCPGSRNGVQLICSASNVKSSIKEMWLSELLWDIEGNKSDHHGVVCKLELPRQDVFTKTKFRFRPYTTEGEQKFGRLIYATDWSCIKAQSSTASVEAFTTILNGYLDACFPFQERTVKSNDLPWANRIFKRAARRRNRCFKKEGKSMRWKNLSKEAVDVQKHQQACFLDKMTKMTVSDGSSRAFFKAVNCLKHREAPKRWEIKQMFPEDSEPEIAEKVAEYFNRISNEYTPVLPPTPTESVLFPPFNKEEIIKKLKLIKKPKGLLNGDIFGKLNNKFGDALATPLYHIFEQVRTTAEWPLLWKSEIVTVIPKNSSPARLNDCVISPARLSTLNSWKALYWKKLKSEVTLSDTQYGGQKGCGFDHFLIETWNTVLSDLEDHRAASNLVSIDFKKAFNRMDHNTCINVLKQKGASPGTVALVQAFLSGRTMSVKVGKNNSIPRSVPGGSPQGSILANFLFCCTVDSLSSQEPDRPSPSRRQDIRNDIALPSTPIRPIGYEAAVTSTPITRSPSSSDSSLDESVRFFRARRPFMIESSAEGSFLLDQDGIDELLGIPDRWIDRATEIRCYIDDFNNLSKVRLTGSVTHITSQNCRTLVHANKCEHLIKSVRRAAEEKKMRVNEGKTQMLCISNLGKDPKSYIVVDGKRVLSGESLKILGFTFGPKPTVEAHVNTTLTKLRKRLWTLSNLKRAGMGKDKLAGVFFAIIRPVADFAAPVYHPMLNSKLSDALEKIQRRAFKIIYGDNVSYRAVLETKGFKSMSERRQYLFENFAVKSSANARFQNKWFPLNHDVAYNVRTRNKYQEYVPKTERMRKNPVYVMRRLLNNLHR